MYVLYNFSLVHLYVHGDVTIMVIHGTDDIKYVIVITEKNTLLIWGGVGGGCCHTMPSL